MKPSNLTLFALLAIGVALTTSLMWIIAPLTGLLMGFFSGVISPLELPDLISLLIAGAFTWICYSIPFGVIFYKNWPRQATPDARSSNTQAAIIHQLAFNGTMDVAQLAVALRCQEEEVQEELDALKAAGKVQSKDSPDPGIFSYELVHA